ncbi:MAG: GTPase Era [Bacilli bacterium]|nr:GTPase Era [Bacilli bacterium]
MKVGFVSILGLPNVGKSTLINAILSKKVSIVTCKSQTTRDAIMGVYNEKDLQIVYIDTPGLFPGDEALYQLMEKSARRSISGVDAILYVIDSTSKNYSKDEEILSSIKTDSPIILLFNKIDDVRVEQMEALLAHYNEKYPDYEKIQISAKTNFGLKDIKKAVLAHLQEGLPFYPEEVITDKDEPFMAKEVIREEILRFLNDEIPHECAVEIMDFQKRDGGVFIKATIVSEKEGQKAIIIGRNGEMVKKISMAARHNLEKMWKTHVTLICRVECVPGWRNDPRKLQKLGYGRKQEF